MSGILIRSAAIATGFALAAVLVLTRTHQHPHRLLSETDGALKSVEIQFNASSSDLMDSLGSFLSQLDKRVEVIGICSTEEDAVVFRRLAEKCGHQDAQTITAGIPITSWSKDRFLVSDERPVALIRPKPIEMATSLRTNDAKAASLLCERFPRRFQTIDLPLQFDAGDIVPGVGVVFVCDNLLIKNKGGDYNTREKIAKLLDRTFGSEVVWLKSAPMHHVGMFLAPIDGKTVIVGDPELGKSLWTEADTARFGKADFSKASAEPFLQTARKLEDRGFRVIRVPTIIFAPQVFISYTNGVFETRGREKIVYLPQYASRTLDNKAKLIYQSLGWTVRPVPVEKVFRYRGTIGCLVNVLERE